MAEPVVIILGGPGSGKSEQAKRLAAHRRYVHLSTGALLRAAGSEDDKAQMAAGELVSDQAVEGLLRQRLAALDANLPILLDGFPRTKTEAKWLDQTLASLQRQVERVICLSVSVEEAAKRLSLRGRPDDSTEAVKVRMASFEHDTKAVIAFYEHQNKLVQVDGMGSPAEVEARIAAAL